MNIIRKEFTCDIEKDLDLIASGEKNYISMKSIIFLLHLSIFISSFLTGAIKTKTIKTYTISRNFGTETRELSRSTFVRYNSK